jgi:hypothetical protein
LLVAGGDFESGRVALEGLGLVVDAALVQARDLTQEAQALARVLNVVELDLDG